jgi:hypothetical protein
VAVKGAPGIGQRGRQAQDRRGMLVGNAPIDDAAVDIVDE